MATETINFTIDDQRLQVPAGTTILEAARKAGIYIPTLCYHPDLPPAKGSAASKIVFQNDFQIENTLPEESAKGCGICVVEIEGQTDLVGSCATEVQDGMVVTAQNDRIKIKRQENLIPILARHRHACLTCAQQEGCPRSQCSTNVPENERCCPQFGHCELQDVANHVGISDDTPKWVPTDLPVIKDQPLFEMDYNLCIGCIRCVRICRDLRGIEAIGFVYDAKDQVQVGTLAPTLEESACKFCTACVEVCPTGALVDKSVRAAKKEADLVPCREACPAHIDVPGYLRLIADGKRNEAIAVIREKVPFPGILGRVCIHPCEEACRRGELNDPIAICALKRYAADGEKGLWRKSSVIPDDTGKKVAVVGSGPAGLTAAFYLRKKGHAVAVFEASHEAGGMLRYGIPRYRLPQNVIEKEIGEIFDFGIEFKPNMTMGKDFSLGQLKNEGYDAVFLALGAQLSCRIPLEGCDMPDVLWGLEFLKQVAKGEDIRLKENVVVIGGGNVAVEVALTALRCGAQNVSMACLECIEEMPASPWEIEGAVSEGINILPSWGPDKILRQNGNITGLALVECTCVFDDQGNFCPQFGESKESILVDQVIFAVGQATELSFLDNSSSISVAGGLIVVDQESLETGMQGVYAGGDVVTTQGAIIHAIAAGRRAASSIDKELGGNGDIEEILLQRDIPNPRFGKDEGFAAWPREKVPELEIEARHQSFQEVSLGYQDDQAIKEANRCLQCDVRLFLGCNPSPPKSWRVFNQETINQIPDTEGVYQLLDEDHNVLTIKGTANLRRDLLEQLEEDEKAVLFEYEEDKMYSQRESELIQRYLQKHGEMPGGGEKDDDLW
ncbi:MAG: FAD-dependent oxidoreductase [Deltaproteobacteria bacterium]|nr:MAG: FAD-dependent oxidoreductase [Deltaproteobacteria bacterium]